MSIRVTVTDNAVRLLVVDLTGAGRGIKGRVADVFNETGPRIVRTAKQLVPKDTHALERSLGYTVNRRIPRLRIGAIKSSINPKTNRPASTYAKYVHDGTSRVGPRPFIDNAIRKHTTDQSNYMRGLRKAGIANIGRSTGGRSA